MNREMLGARSVQISLAALVLAFAFALWSGTRAYRLTSVASAQEPAFASGAALARNEMTVPADIQSVVSQNPFSADRKAPSVRYRLGGYANEGPATPPPQPVVLGTTVADEHRSFAVASVGDSRATVVRIGDKIGGYTVKSIERGLVVFTTPAGDRLVITAR
ncbi:MAG TPA: hypothetical protein VE967_03700 [Gemmatimonadaceae bacterium]|nr:hypothetical protein [Gemmatimonadaceae bacterium]